MEYLKQLQNKVLAKNAFFMGSTETSQIAGSKHKEITTIFSEDEVG